MDASDRQEAAVDATARFERELEALVLEAFAAGAAVEGTWTVGGAVAALPAWAVEVTRTAAAEPAYDLEFIE